jgi:hypothetical protein
MSDRTVKKHLKHLYEKLNVQTRVTAVMVALEQLGLVRPSKVRSKIRSLQRQRLPFKRELEASEPLQPKQLYG